MTSDPIDLYKILGVARDATTEQIKRMFRKLSKRWHPDMQGGNAEKFQEIEEAYRVLSNEEERAFYDSTGKPREQRDAPNDNAALYAMIDSLLMDAIQNIGSPTADNLIDFMRKELKASIANTHKRSQGGAKVIERMHVVAKRIKSKGEKNVLRALVLSQIQEIEGRLKGAADSIELQKAALAWLDDYEYDVDRMLAHLNDAFVYAGGQQTEVKYRYVDLKWGGPASG